MPTKDYREFLPTILGSGSPVMLMPVTRRRLRMPARWESKFPESLIETDERDVAQFESCREATMARRQFVDNPVDTCAGISDRRSSKIVVSSWLNGPCNKPPATVKIVPLPFED